MWLMITVGAAIAVVIFGPRSTFGLFVDPVIANRGWGRGVFALAMGIQQLTWGILPPAAGALAGALIHLPIEERSASSYTASHAAR